MIEANSIYGELRVVSEADGSKAMVACVCSCGQECLVRRDHLLSGHTTSCGCVKAQRMYDYSTMPTPVRDFLYSPMWWAVHERKPTLDEARQTAELFASDPDAFWAMVRARTEHDGSGQTAPTGYYPEPESEPRQLEFAEILDRSLSAELHQPRPPREGT